MSIWAYVGLPGQGKSYHAVAEQILPALREGRCVVTNIPLNIEALREAGAVGPVVEIGNDELQANPEIVIAREFAAGAVVVLDELWRFLPQGLSGRNVPESWRSFFAEHRHRVDAEGRSTQIVLVTQDLSQVAAFARALVERTVVVTKLTVVGAAKRYRVDTYAGSVTGLKPPMKKRISEEYGTYDARVFACYTSHTMSQGSGTMVDESVISSRGSFLRHPMVRYGLPIAAVLFAFGLWRSYQFFFVDPVEAVEKGKKVASELSGGNSNTKRSSPRGARGLIVQQSAGMRYRVAAIIRADDDNYTRVLLDHCDGGPGRWLPWYAAHCMEGADGWINCNWRGHEYGFHAAIRECRPEDESRAAEIQWFPSDDSGSREQVSVVGGS